VVLNAWLEEFKKQKQYTYLYNKYFKNPKSARIYESEFYSRNSGKISVYDEVIKKYSQNIGWDWRLIASLIYQESKFHPEVRSWAGAYGLMQLMPETAAQFGVDSLAGPEQQIEAGIRFLKYIDKQLEEVIEDPEERVKFILASYNVGIGHVLDARRLADKYGKDSNKWFANVDTFLLQKSEPKFYRDPVVYYGYCRGTEPVNFVSEILQRYDHYKNFTEQ
jgi:membrane-bound lytic murein transglycosylase F